VTDNSPFLGQHFLTPPDQISDVNKFSKLTESVYQFPTESTVDPEVDALIYQVGAKINILANKTANHLLLPVNAPGTNFCPRDAPVRFLSSTKTNCLRELTPENCASDEISVDKYLEQIVSKTAHGAEKTNASVRYLCDTSKGEKYVRVQKQDNRKMSYGDESSASRFIDCDSIFLTSFFEPRSRICYNALLRIDYIFTWNGTNITHVNATFKFADIPILEYKLDDTKAPKFYLSQQFTVKFEHVFVEKVVNETSNSSEPSNYDESSDALKWRSGNPGYIDGKPLILGTLTSR